MPMDISSSHSIGSPQPIRWRALWVTAVIGLIGLFFLIVAIAYGWIEQPVDYLLAGMPLLVFLAGSAGVVLILRRRTELGVTLALGANLLMSLVIGVFIFGLATGIGSYAFASSMMLIYTGLPERRQRQASWLTLGVMLVLALFEFWNPGFRVTSPQLIDLANYFSFALWFIFLVIMAGQIRSRSISVERRINDGFMVVVYVSVLISLMSVRTFRDYNAASIALVGEANRVQAAHELQTALWQMKAAEMQVVLSPQSAQAEAEWSRQQAALEQAVPAWAAVMAGAEGTEQVRDGIEALVGEAGRVVAAARAGRVDEAQALEADRVGPLTTALSAQVSEALAEALARRAQAEAVLNLVIRDALLRTLGVALFALMVGLVLSTSVIGSIVRPLSELQRMAQALGGGDRSVRARVAPDEIGLVAGTLNSTVEQLDQLYSSLESQVADRTRALEVSAEVSRRLSTILDPDHLVHAVTEQLRQAFHFYHVDIYLFDEARQNLLLVAGTGEAGRELLAKGHRVLPGQGVVGRVAATHEMVLVPDTAREPGFLPNPMLPQTRAQVAVPIAIGPMVLGVLDVQQNATHSLSPEDARLIASIANQVAIALQNARAYVRAESQARHEQIATDVAQKVQQANRVDEVLQVAVRELGRALGARRVQVELRSSALAKPDAKTPVGL